MAFVLTSCYSSIRRTWSLFCVVLTRTENLLDCYSVHVPSLQTHIALSITFFPIVFLIVLILVISFIVFLIVFLVLIELKFEFG